MLATQLWKLRRAGKVEFAVADVVFMAVIGVTSTAAAAIFLVQEHRLLGVLGMPLDDAWIHFRIAKNLAMGGGFAFNPGEPTSASTSPGWTGLLALAYLATGQFVVPAIALGVLFYVATNLAVYHLALEMTPDRRLALAAGVLTAVTGRWVWASLSGMETTLFTALSLWGLLLFVGSRSVRPPALAAGATLLATGALVRPGGFLLLGLVFLVVALETRGSAPGVSPVRLIQRLLRGRVSVLAMAVLATVALRLAYTLGTGGGALGNTFLAQSLPQGDSGYTGPRLLPDLWYLRSAVQSLRGDDFVLGLLIPLGMVLWIRYTLRDRSVQSLGLLCMLWFVALPLLNSVVAPNLRHHERYLMPLIPLAVLFGTFGIGFLVEQLVSARWHARVPGLGRSLSAAHLFVLVAAICLGDALIDTKRWSVQYAGDVRSIQAINITLGTWLRDNTPPDAYVAMNDIGAIAFISERRVLDTVGIAEPEIFPFLLERGREGVFAYLQQRRPDYVVIWPEWYPEIAARTDILTPVYSAEMKDPLTATRDTMLGGREMVVYKARWPSP